VAVVLALAAMSCDSGNGSNCEAGTLGCRCLEDDRCNESLSCLSNVCVGEDEEDAGPPDATTDAEPTPADAGDAGPGEDGSSDAAMDAGDAGDDAGDAGDADPGDGGEVSCEALAAPAQGSVNVDTTAVGGIASYGCELGFGIVGVASRACQGDGTWTDSAPTCAPGDCESLTSPANGTVTTPNGTATGEAASYACNAGYVLDGVASRTCQTDSSWSDAEPSCAPVDCGAPEAPASGSVDSSLGTTFGLSVTYTCNAGHELQGDAMRSCEADGSWSGTAPSCEPVDCGGLPAPGQGSVSTAAGTTFGATATYSCEPGYGIVGGASRTCQASGNWSGNAPTCAPGDCEGLLPPEDGTVSTPSGTTLNAVATYACNDGHNLVGSATRTCQASGSWSGTAPMCQIVSCPSLSNPDDGTVSTPGGITYGEVATYSCSPGHNRNGSQTRTCQASGQWSGSAPTCDIVNCLAPTPPMNGTVSTPGGTTYNQTASYACRVGFYRTGSATRTCQASGSWSGSMPSCSDGHTEGLRLTQLRVGTNTEFVRIMNRGAVTAALTGVRFELRDSSGTTYTHDFAGGTLAANASATIGEGSVDHTLSMNLAAARAGAVMLCAASPCSSESVRDAFTYEGDAVAPALPSGVTVNAPVHGVTASNEGTEDFYRVQYTGAAPTFTSCDWSAAPQQPLFVEHFECGFSRWTQSTGTFTVDTSGSPDGSDSFLQQTAGGIDPVAGMYYQFPTAVRPSHIEYWTKPAARTFMCAMTNTSCEIIATIYWDYVGNLCAVGAAAGPCLDTPDNSWSHVVFDGFDWVNGTADYWVNGTRIGDNVAFGTSYPDNAGMRRFLITGGLGSTDGIRMW
jgi:hypothetical protein